MYRVTSNAFVGFNEVVSGLGVDPAPLLADYGFTTEELASSSGELPLGKMISVLCDAAELTECEYLGLLMGAQQAPVFMGALGPITRSANSVRKAIKLLQRYVSIQATGLSWVLDVNGHTAYLRVQFNHNLEGDLKQAIYLTTMHVRRWLRYISGNKWKAMRYHFGFRSLTKQVQVHRLLGAPIDFDAEFNGIEFDASLLDLALPNQDSYLQNILEQQLTQASRNAPSGLLDEVAEVMRKLLLVGDCSIDLVAEFFPFDKRTLQRRLKAKETSYQQLLDTVRLNLAKQHLASSEISITRLSGVLGFSEHSVFTRAFKKETGLSPSHWRMQHSG